MQEMSRLLSYACAATLCLGLAVITGCGGGGESAVPPASGKLTGTITQGSGTSSNVAPIAIPASGGTPVTVTVGGVPVTVTIPSSTITDTVPVGAVIAVLNSGGVLAAGDYGAGATIGIGGDLASALASLSAKTSGITLSNLGGLIQNLGIPIDPGPAGTRVVLSLPQGNVKTRDLTIGTQVIDGKTYIKGGNVISHVPLSITGTIPNNGENAAGAKETAIWGAGNAGRSATLDVVYGNGFTLHQARVIDAANTVVFQDITTDTSNVPAGGVQSVTLTVGPLP